MSVNSESERTERERILKENPIQTWIAVSSSPVELRAVLCGMLHLCPINKLADQPNWEEATNAQISLLRWMAPAIHGMNVSSNTEIIRQFQNPTQEEYTAALEWLKAALAV